MSFAGIGLHSHYCPDQSRLQTVFALRCSSLNVLIDGSRKNVSACVAGFDPTSGVVEMAVRELGAERVIFGSDAAGRSFASQLAKVTGAEIPRPARRLILGENLRRLLTPILRAKGHQA